jgi:hypothetical protein
MRITRRWAAKGGLWLVASCAITYASCANAAPPVAFYSANVTAVDRVSEGSVVITTKDSVATVCEWYRKNLQEKTGETVTADGAHIFYTHSGATVDVELGSRFDPGTKIGLAWDAKKFGPYPGK